MFELFGAKHMPSNKLSLIIYLGYSVTLAAGWLCFIYATFEPSEDMPKLLWYGLVTLPVLLGVSFFAHRIEQYWLNAIWGLAVARGLSELFERHPEVREAWDNLLVEKERQLDGDVEV